MGLFVRHGYRLTSMELVGQQAGLTRQALYHHFGSKEALFLAVVETIQRGAQDAADTAGLAQERSGAGLAEVLVTQIVARWQYVSDRVNGSPHADELLSEHRRQSKELNQVFTQSEVGLLVETIDRFCAHGLRLRAGLTASELARGIQLAARGVKADLIEERLLADLETVIGLMVAGALDPTARTTQSTDGRSGT